MHEILSRYLSRKLSRRNFVEGITTLGFSRMAAASILAFINDEANANADEPAVHDNFQVVEGNGGKLLVEQLRATGAKYIFHTNTGGLHTFLEALLDVPEMHLIMVTHEGQAVSVAQGYALATGKVAFFIGSQVGVGNSISNLYNAWKDRTPLIASFTRVSLDDQGGADGSEEWDGHLKPTEPFTRWSWSCVAAETFPETLLRGMKLAVAPPGGPVALDFPQDLLQRKTRGRVQATDPVQKRPLFRPNHDAVLTAAKWLVEAANPVLIAGPEISRRNANGALRHLAEMLSLPVYQARQELFCDFPTDHPLFLGSYLPPVRFPRKVDLVVSFGARFDRSEAPPPGARVVQVSEDVPSLGQSMPTDLVIAADVASTLSDLSDAVGSILTKDRLARIRSSRLQEVNALTQKLRQAREQALRANFDKAPLSWERVGYELEKVLDKNAVLVPELGSQGNKVLGHLTFGGENKLRIGRTTGSALGWGMGAALGVQLGLPDRQVVALQGDGGLLFGQTETLWSIARYEAPILTIVLNNHSYNETRNRTLSHSSAMFAAGKDITSYLGDPDVDFTKIASAYGLIAEKVREPRELPAALNRAVRSTRDGKPVLLDLEVRRDGILAESTWHPPFSIAKLAKRRGSTKP